MEDPASIVRLVAKTSRSMREESGDIIRVLLATAPHDKSVSEGLAVATARYRQAFIPIAQRLLDLGALRAGLDVKEAVDIFWFYFGYAGLFTLHDDNGCPMHYTDLLRLYDAQVVTGRHYALKTRWLADLTPEIISLVTQAGTARTSPLSFIAIHHFHGPAPGSPRSQPPSVCGGSTS